LLKVERNDAKRLMGMLPHMFQHSLHNNRGFARIATVLANTVTDKVVFHSQCGITVICGRKDNEIPLVELLIRERNQTVMAGAIMPTQPSHRLEQRTGDIKDALSFLYGSAQFFSTVVFLVERYTTEETRGRQLFWIAYDNNLPSSG